MIDTSQTITELLPALNSGTTADLTWWSTDELYSYADEAAQRLARSSGAFADFDQTTAFSALVQNPAGCLTLLHVAANGIALRPATVREVEALSASWASDTCPAAPSRWIEDVGGLGTITLYPIPIMCTLDRLYHAEPAAIAAGTPTVSMPSALAALFYWAMLARARAKEGESQMPDVAAHAGQRVGELEKVALAYYGGTE